MLSACSTTVPVLVIENNKEVMRGHRTVSAGTGFIEISKYSKESKLLCSGTFNTYDFTPEVVATLSCNDGRRGSIYMYHNAIGQSGHGRLELNDGYRAKVIYGNVNK